MHYLSYNEGKRHGTEEFPVAYYYIDEEHLSYNMPFHWHREWEIIRILQGSLQLFIDGQEYIAYAGDILLLREGVLHGGTPAGCIYECFNFDLHGLFRNVLSVRDYLRPFYRNALLPYIHYSAEHSGLMPMVSELLDAFHSSQPRDLCALTTLGNLSRLFAAILQNGWYTQNAGVSSETARRADQLKTVLEYIETHYSSPLSLSELSGVIGMNPKYFCRFF